MLDETCYFQIQLLTTVRAATVKSHRNRPTNFQLLRKRRVNMDNPMHVSVHEITRMTAALSPAIAGLQGVNASWVNAQCAEKETKYSEKVQTFKSKSIECISLISQASCLYPLHSAISNIRTVDPAKSDNKQGSRARYPDCYWKAIFPRLEAQNISWFRRIALKCLLRPTGKEETNNIKYLI